MSIRTVILHVGPPRCGSSHVQAVLRRNEEDLKEKGVLYPRTGREKGSHAPFERAFRDGDSGGKMATLVGDIPAAELVERLRTECDDVGGETVILSSEAFWARSSVANLVKALECSKAVVVAVWRRQDQIIDSIYSRNRMVGKETGSLAQAIAGLVNRRRLDYSQVLDEYMNLEEISEVRLVPLLGGSNQERFEIRFLDAAGIALPSPDLPRTDFKANASPTPLEIEYFRKVGSDKLRSETFRDEIRKRFARIDGDLPAHLRRRRYLTQRQAREVTEVFEEANRTVLSKYDAGEADIDSLLSFGFNEWSCGEDFVGSFSCDDFLLVTRLLVETMDRSQ